ncbi:MAG: hypothetical protein U5K51_02680 [Flavobacteriaceae bacterium]|nr:hypothetical protein [Flavobacteriaceae bacterium]
MSKKEAKEKKRTVKENQVKALLITENLFLLQIEPCPKVPELLT